MTSGAASIAAALTLMFERLSATTAEVVPLMESPGRTLAGDVTSEANLPQWDNSAMDGYACRSADIASASESAPVRLPVVATIAAGAAASRALATGEAMRIMTGAPVPTGADSVVRVEDTDAGASEVLIRSARDAGANIRPQGEDVRAGDTVLRSGSRLRAAEIALLAALGRSEVAVHKPPRIAILSSGDELVPLSAAGSRAPTHIVSANSYSLAAIVAEAGGEPVDLGIVPDDLEATRAALEKAHGCDLLVTSGGISVGGFDYTRAAVVEAGGEILFWRVPMRPGYNTAFGLIRGTPWLGVPGNPVSALVAGEVLLRPAIRHMCGSRAPLRAGRRVVVLDACPAARGSTIFLRASLEAHTDGLPRARLCGPQGSAILSSSVRADALLIVPPDRSGIAAGQQLDALILRDETAV